MQDTLHFPSATNPLIPTFPNPNFPPKSTPSFLRQHKPSISIFAALSSKSPTTLPLPPKPSKTLKLPDSNLTLPDPNPQPLTLTLDSSLHEKALYLDSIGLDSISLLSNSSAISAAISAASFADLRQLLDYLSSFNLDLKRIITMCPEIITLRQNDVVPVFTFLLREAHVSSTHLRHVISRRPRLLVSDVSTRLRPTMYFLQSIGIHDVSRHTDLLSCSVEDKFIPKIDYFQNVGFSHKDSISMFRRFPPLFCYSVKENYEPKFNYFVVEMGRELKELKEFPQYFSFSLENRIKVRHQSCVENGVCLSLAMMLKMREEVFRQRLDVCCNSSMPRSNSPLWCANNSDVETLL